jgi:Tol biopolymer transport system component
MAATAPPRPPRVPGFDESEQLEALIKEARRRARLRRVRYATCVLLAASAGTVAVLGPGRGGGVAGTAAPEPSPADAPWEIKLAGPRLAYVPEPRFALYVTKPDGSGARELTGCEQTTVCVIKDPVWSPDGRRIAYLRGRLYRGTGSVLALYVIGVDGRGERRLAECGACGMPYGGGRPSWSPDGSQIAFTDGRGLSTVDVESGRVRRLTTCPEPGCMDISPDWSPDHSAIAFTRFTGEALERDRRLQLVHALYRVSVNGSQLTRLAADGMNPAWAPDGKTILVDTRRGIESVAADGSHTAVIAPGRSPAEGPGVPSWSPDGSRILYFTTPHEKLGYRAEVWTMKPNGTDTTRLYRGSCCIGTWSKPVWSADGTRVALSASRGPRYEVWAGGTFVVDSDGTGLRKLTQLPADLAWQPTHQRSQGRRR